CSPAPATRCCPRNRPRPSASRPSSPRPAPGARLLEELPEGGAHLALATRARPRDARRARDPALGRGHPELAPPAPPASVHHLCPRSLLRSAPARYRPPHGWASVRVGPALPGDPRRRWTFL